MEIIVFGATGGVGQHFVEMAVKAGHTVALNDAQYENKSVGLCS